MRENICTLPVVDIFSEVDGCPLCRMKEKLNERITDYILGPAMMDPDIRIATNKEGFCEKHLNSLLEKDNKLQFALILESHLEEFSKVLKAKDAKKINSAVNECFICNKINWGYTRMLKTIMLSYENDSSFRKMFENQEYFCPSHAADLIENANKKTMKSYHKDFTNFIIAKSLENLSYIKENIIGFKNLFDYRSSYDKEKENLYKNAPKLAVDFLKDKK